MYYTMNVESTVHILLVSVVYSDLCYSFG